MLDKLDFVAFRRIEKSNHTSAAGLCRTIGKRIAFCRGVFGERFEIVHFECEVRDIRTHVYGTAPIELADLDLFITARGFEEDQFRTARRLRTVGFFQSKHVLVKMDSLVQIRNSVTGVKELVYHRLETATNESRGPSTRKKIPVRALWDL